MQLRLLFLIMFMLSVAHGTQAQPRRTADVCDPEWLATASAASVRNLVREGANANERCSGNGNRPLHQALLIPVLDPGVIEALIDAGADVLAENRDGDTPFDYADTRFARAERQLPPGSPPYEREARIYQIMYRYADAAEEDSESTTPARARSQTEPAEDRDDDEGPERFFYIGVKHGTALSSGVLNTVAGNYHPGVTAWDIALNRRLGLDPRLLKYPDRQVGVGPASGGGLEALWLNARNSTGFGVSFNWESLWIQHRPGDVGNVYWEAGSINVNHSASAVGAAVVYGHVKRYTRRELATYGGLGVAALTGSERLGELLPADWWGTSVLDPQYEPATVYLTGGLLLMGGPGGLTYGMNATYYGALEAVTLSASVGWRFGR